MIKEIKTYTVICDNCNMDSNHESGVCGWNDKSFAEEVAIEGGWIEHYGNHYCPKCYDYDDDDELIIRKQ